MNAMRGMAAARAQQAAPSSTAVDSYAATIAAAIGRAITLAPPVRRDGIRRSMRPALVLFCRRAGLCRRFQRKGARCGRPLI